MNVDTLSGHELDMAVARKVLGYKVEERVNAITGEKKTMCRQQGGAWVLVAPYGASMGAFLNVEFELQHRGWKRRVTRTVKERGPAGGPGWKRLPAPKVSGPQEVVLVEKDGRSVKAKGESLGEALARAALKAVMP